jgi:hypothetical protein
MLEEAKCTDGFLVVANWPNGTVPLRLCSSCEEAINYTDEVTSESITNVMCLYHGECQHFLHWKKSELRGSGPYYEIAVIEFRDGRLKGGTLSPDRSNDISWHRTSTQTPRRNYGRGSLRRRRRWQSKGDS